MMSAAELATVNLKFRLSTIWNYTLLLRKYKQKAAVEGEG